MAMLMANKRIKHTADNTSPITILIILLPSMNFHIMGTMINGQTSIRHQHIPPMVSRIVSSITYD
jgi:hypothetical protein